MDLPPAGAPPAGLSRGVDGGAMRITIELEAADPDTLLSSEALKAFIALSRAGIEITRVDAARGQVHGTGVPDPPEVVRAREVLVSRGRRLEAAFTVATRDAVEGHRRAGREG